MVHYIVNIKNKSTEIQSYLLFNDPPTQGQLGTPYSNVWLKSLGVNSPNGVGSFSIPADKTYAMCGTTTTGGPLTAQVQLQTSDYKEVKLAADRQGGDIVSLEHKDGGFVFDPSVSATTTLGGSYGINTAPFDANQYNYVWCGIGRPAKNGDITPVVSWRAYPSKQYLITPILKFWVSTGNFEAGLVIDKTTFGNICEIDFTGKSETIATIEHKSDGSFSSPQYSFPSAARPGRDC